MSLILQKMQQLERVDCLIRRRATGKPAALAQRLSVSERTIFNLLEDLRDFGAPVRYCKDSQSYYYTDAFDLPYRIIA
jgi:predicted DNA-binding transcriptional regulator YafY